jgi:hypothetical protein
MYGGASLRILCVSHVGRWVVRGPLQTRGPVLIFLCLVRRPYTSDLAIALTVVLIQVSLIGLPIMGFVKNPWGKYAGVFITVSGTNSAIPSVMAYQANNIRGQWRRAFCSAVSICSRV